MECRLLDLEDKLNLAVIDENWKIRVGRQTELRARFNAPDLTVRQMGPFQIINLEGHEITIGAYATDEQIGAEIAKIRQTESTRMGWQDRLKEKALKAKGVVPRLAASVESELDGIIGAEAEIEQQKQAAFAPHKEAIKEVSSGLEDIQNALKIMQNEE